MPKFNFNTTVILMTLIVLAALATWVVPAGSYDKTEIDGRQVLVEGSYHSLEASPQNVFDVLKAPVTAFGRSNVAAITAFLLIVGGAFMVIEKTGALAALIAAMSALFLRRPKLRHFFIPVTVVLFSLGGTLFGMEEEALIFIPILIPLAISMRYDAAVGMAIPLLGTHVGFAAAFMNPFSVGVAQGLAGLPAYSGLGLRFALWATATAITVIFIMLYARKVEKEPKNSLTYEYNNALLAEFKEKSGSSADVKFTLPRILVLAAFALTMIAIVVGVLKFGWYMTEIAAAFFALGIAAALLGRLGVNDATKAFYEGVRSMAEIVFLLALTTAILIVAEDGNILDTVLHAMAGLVSNFGAAASAVSAFVMEFILTFFVPSSSGRAVLTIPILAPLSDLIGVSRQTMVLAYQTSEYANLISPTNAVLLAALGLGRVPLPRWIKTLLPLIAVLALVTIVFINIAVAINWQ